MRPTLNGSLAREIQTFLRHHRHDNRRARVCDGVLSHSFLHEKDANYAIFRVLLQAYEINLAVKVTNRLLKKTVIYYRYV